MRRHPNREHFPSQRTFLLRPPERTTAQKFKDLFWDKRDGTCLTRTPVNWLAISLYYSLFLVGVMLVFYVSMLIAEIVASWDANRPQYILEDSPIGTSPGINYFPLRGAQNLIWLAKGRPYDGYVKVICNMFESYRKKSVNFSTDRFAECGNPPYGYNLSTPCLYFRLNRILLWEPKPFRKGDKFPKDMPAEVRDQIEKSDTPKIWFSCNGTTAKDRDHITQDFFEFQGGSGFDVSPYPFDQQSDFIDPIVAMKFNDLRPRKVLYSFTCTAWGDKMDREKAKVEEAFELFDSNNDGYLDYYEFKASSRCLGFHLRKPELLLILETYARFDKNTISYEDFYEVMEEKMVKRDPMDEIKEAFRLIANDKTNAITFRDLKHAAEKVGADIPDRDLRSMIEEFDTKGEGKLDEEDFIGLITGEAL